MDLVNVRNHTQHILITKSPAMWIFRQHARTKYQVLQILISGCHMRHVLKKLLVVSKKTCKTCTLSFTHSGHAEQLLFLCLCSKVTLTFSLSLTPSHSFNLSFTHFRHAEQVLFSSLCSKFAVYRRKLQCFFLTAAPPSPVSVTLEFIELVPS